MRADILNGLEIWADRISDLLLFDVPEHLEEAVAETLLVMILPALAISPWAMLHDNDAGPDTAGPP
ncbi:MULTISPECIES: hypothetical protein [unclassified Sphingomonas]|uniref:hypothetical protein n=1 Tax=unclassified Sphingomonas TaxID=196159 RepID=UPI0006FB3613|nr:MULTISPECIES: hypothetical protein [unclassified Sphingomonas]KQX18419.1 hypothetical protein ASD17_14755 [Sphingomonas sp. Root1294]KQY72256.1 hypothetical protein ASD39_20220 [Sphingomonas sp. Root50]